MVLLSLSASHRDLDLDVLEQLSSGSRSVATSVVADSPDITGCVVLATCNRFEVYLDAAVPADDDAAVRRAVDEVCGVVARSSGLEARAVTSSLQPAVGAAVATHLFSVAAGLDSMVVGEREVSGQVRRALQTARAGGTTSSALERLFQHASRASRAVGSRTALGGTGRSVVGVALDLVAEQLDLASSSVLLIGTGSYAGASLTALRARGVTDVSVYSPSGRAAAFAADRGLQAVPAGGLEHALAHADLVVSCSGALGPVVDARVVADARQRSAAHDGVARPTVLVDLALTHDVDPAVRSVPGVRLVDLVTVQQHAPHALADEVMAGRKIVDEHAAAFEATLAEQQLVPAVVALRRHVGQALEAEVGRARAGLEPDVADRVERSLRRFAASVLHTPAVRAREHARLGRHDAYREGLEAVFGLHVEAPKPADDDA
ncbi:glutamyl-tRNA reductase [Actinotalea sp. AC32]|nr:glutamyl-tRNA reductase [Actinotalea sp. AC32]